MHYDEFEAGSQNVSIVFNELNEVYQGPSDVHLEIKNQDYGGVAQSNKANDTIKGIRILTYNFYLRPPYIENVYDFKNERVKELKKQKVFHQFDVICFQEVFGSFCHRKEKIIKYAMEAGLIYAADSPSPSFFSTYFIEAGLLILSRYPIVEQDFQPFCYGIMADALANKGILYAKIEVENGIYLHVFNVHTQASYENYNTPYYIKKILHTRYDQLKEIQESIRQFLKKYNWRSHEKVILIGDFNIDYNHHLFPSSYFDQKKVKDNLILIVNDQYDEYNTMLKLLSNNFADQIIN